MEISQDEANEAIAEWVDMGFLEVGVRPSGEFCFWLSDLGVRFLG
jgi:hypothetical protein